MGDEVVGFWLLLLRSRVAKELHVVTRIVLAVDQLINFLLATENMGVALEKALTHIIEDGQAKGFYFGTGLMHRYACSA